MLFEFKNVGKTYGIQKIFHDVKFKLDRGTFSIVTGPSGAGKTTFFKMLCGIERPNEGEVHFLGKKLIEHSPTHLKNIGLIFQSPKGLPDMSVAENIGLPLAIDRMSKSERDGKVARWLDILGLRSKANALYRELSGGEIQKAEFARALIRKPRLILADEPTAHLDSVQADLLLDVLWEHYKDGATVFISTHHPPRFEHPEIHRYHVSNMTIRRIGASVDLSQAANLGGLPLFDPAQLQDQNSEETL
ncbi:MAG: ATP-binding cassette domain-containing protein [Deltaproteobacteria bacterium]|nr:ATP-binding cassette domain-containing protein [Deltaproteobacteria bacterium]